MVRQTARGLVQDNKIANLIPHLTLCDFVHTKSIGGAVYLTKTVRSDWHGLVTYIIRINGNRYPAGRVEQAQATSCDLLGPTLDLRNGVLKQEQMLCTSHVTSKGALASLNYMLQMYNRALIEFREKEVKLIARTP